MLFEQWSRRTGHDNNRKYLWNKSRTGRRRGSWATPHQRPRAFCMTRSGTGQLSRSFNRGHLCTIQCPVHPAPRFASVGVRFWNRFAAHSDRLVQCAVGGGAVRVRRRSLLLRRRPLAPHDRRTLTRSARRRVT